MLAVYLREEGLDRPTVTLQTAKCFITYFERETGSVPQWYIDFLKCYEECGREIPSDELLKRLEGYMD